MQKTQLVRLFSKMSKEDRRSFGDFVQSPYFNKHKQTKLLAEYLLKSKDLTGARLDRKKVFKKIFPDREYEEQLLSNVISYLLRLLRKFYVQKQNEKSEQERDLQLLEYATATGQKHLFELSLPAVKRKRNKQIIRDSDFYLQESKIAQLADDFDLKYGNRTGTQPLEDAFKGLDIYYLGEKLRLACQMLARLQVTGGHYAYPMMDEVLQHVESQEAYFQQIPGVWLYYLVFNLMKKNESAYYYRLKEKMRPHIQSFKHQEGRDLYTHALNYCIKRLNLGDFEFRKETFDLYLQMRETGLLYLEGSLPQWDYTNIVSLGCELKEYRETEKFILEEKEKLPHEVQENVFNYNLAAYKYAQKQYLEAIELLQRVEYTDVYFNLLSRILLLKNYYDLGDEKALEYSLETFRIYLLRNKSISNIRRKSGLNLTRFTKKLLRLSSLRTALSLNEFTRKAEKLKKEITETQAVLNRAWLLEKLEGSLVQ